ncbi:MAG TPA: hypothetical protein VG148_04855, partial [Pyrinomonadaceae bacterium]|nr:hypothetical protein [Pyrinomonadaceae bacterium]
LASNGATAAASSVFDSTRLPVGAINGDRRGLHWGSDPATGSGWTDGTNNAYPDWIEIAFAGPRVIQEVSVFTLQDNYPSPAEPTLTMTFTKFGVTAFQVQYWTGSAWANVTGGAVTGNNKVWRQFTFTPLLTTKIRVLVNNALAGNSRITEVEAWAELSRANHALASNGATATATSVFDSTRLPVAAINGDHKGLHWGSDPATGSGWTDGTNNAYPDRLEIAFAGERVVDEINVFTLQDNYPSPVEPTEAMTFTKFGITAFQVEYWTGSAWAAVPGAAVTGNNKVWRRFTFSPLSTTKLRLTVSAALAGNSRVVEVEAWGPGSSAPPPPPPTNHALASNGATAAASSVFDSTRLPIGAINGDRRGLHWGSDPATGSGWTDGTQNVYPDWLEITFSGAKSLTEISVFTLQDNYPSPAEPTLTMTFTKFGIQDFDVQYWTGSAWATVPGGAITGNNKVWRKVTFPALTTTKIRVLVKKALAGNSRIVEVEAY